MTTCRALVGHLAGVAPAAVPLAAGEVVAAAVDQEQQAEVGEGKEQDGQQDPGQRFFWFTLKYLPSGSSASVFLSYLSRGSTIE